MRRKVSHSIRTKFILGTLAAIALAGAISYLSFSRAAKRQSLEGLRSHAIGLAENTAFVTAPLIAFESHNAINQALDAAAKNPDFEYAVLFNREGQAIASRNPTQMPELPLTESTATLVAGDTIHVTTPVEDAGQPWGYFRLGLSLYRMNAELSRTRQTALVTISALSVLAMIGIGWMIEFMISRPLSALTKSTETLARGEYPKALPIRADDEIGSLTTEFNRTTAKLQSANRELEKLRDLELRRERERGEQALAEERNLLRTLVDHLPDQIFVKDTHGLFLLDNVSHARGLGRTGPNEVIGKTEFQFLPQKAAQRHHEDEQEVMRSGRRMVNREELVVDKEGNRQHFLTSKVPLRNNQGETVGVVGISHDITDRKRAEEALRESEAALRSSQQVLQALTARLISAQEEERRRLARELHDGLNQRLAALSIEVEKLARRLPAPVDVIRDKLRFFGERIGNLSDAVHGMSHQLHPAVLDDLGLVAALNAECAGFSEREGIPVAFSHRDLPDLSARNISLCLFRVAQESLHNIAKHARATEVSVALTGAGNEIRLSIRDSGVGFAPEQVRGRGGLGLASMEERVRQVQGTLSVQSQPGQGTAVEVRVPRPREGL